MRTTAGLSRSALARRAGLPVALLADIEECASMPENPALSSISSALGRSVQEVMLAAGHITDRALASIRRDAAHYAGILGADHDRAGQRQGDGLPAPVLATHLGRLYQADCIDLLISTPGASVDLVFADPPFNLDKDYGEAVSDAMSEQRYIDWCHNWIGEAIRVLKPGGSFYLYNLPKWNMRLGAWISQYLEFRHWIAVDIKFSLPIQGRLYPAHYSLLYFTKGRRPSRFAPPRVPIDTCRHCGGELRDYGGYKDRMNPAGVNISDVWSDLSPVRHPRFKRRKANELPLKMLDRVLDISSDEGDVILDPFGGSGTTYVAAELKGRNWVGSEVSDCQPILDRFAHISRDRELLASIRSRVNVLFTEDTLKLRSRNGHDSSRYRTASAGPLPRDQGTLF
jgi:site-specific DNA-methyltransferase (adenine-specific)